MDQQRTKRYRGFVVGSDTTSEGRTVWKVRVKDESSSYDGQKLVVASIQGGLELARGLNVHFVIGTVDDSFGDKILRAVDVCVDTPDEKHTTKVNRSVGG